MSPFSVSLWALFRAFLYMGSISFGGGVVAYLRRTLVQEKRWLDDDEFLTGLELCQTLPGLIATNMSLYVGRRLRGTIGALVAFIGMTMPGLVFVLALGAWYGANDNNAAVNAVLKGAAAAATGFLLAITLQIGRKILVVPRLLVFVIITFVAVSLCKLSLVIALLCIGPFAIWLCRTPEEHPTVAREKHE